MLPYTLHPPTPRAVRSVRSYNLPQTHTVYVCGSSVVPLEIVAHPINRQCFSILLLKATFSPSFVHAGLVNCNFAASALTATTFAPVAVDPIFTISTSFFASLATFACFPSAVFTPSSLLSKK